MAGRILLNTSMSPFRVRPQQRKRFDDMYDTGQLSGQDYMDQAGKGIDLAMKVYGMANEAAKFSGGGQAVKPDAASLAADQGADAVVAAQQAQMAPQVMGTAGLEDNLQAETAMRQARQMRAMEQSAQLGAIAAQGVATMNTPNQQVDQNEQYLDAMDVWYNAKTPEEKQVAQSRVDAAKQAIAFTKSQMGQGMFQGVNPQNIMANTSTVGLPAQRDQAAFSPVGRSVVDDLMLQSQDQTLEAFNQAEAAVPNALPEFKSIVEAEAALAQAKAAGDIAGWNTAVKAMQNSPLTDVRPQNLQDAIFGTHITRAQQALLKKYPPPKGPSAMDKKRMDNMDSQIDKRKDDIASRVYTDTLKGAKDKRDADMAIIDAKRKKGLISKTEIDTEIAKVEAKHRDAKLRAGIKLQKATTWRNSAQAAETSRKTKFERRMEPNTERERTNKAWAPEIKADAEAKKQGDRQKLQDERLIASAARALKSSRARGAGSLNERMKIRAIADRDAAEQEEAEFLKRKKPTVGDKLKKYQDQLARIRRTKDKNNALLRAIARSNEGSGTVKTTNKTATKPNKKDDLDGLGDGKD